MRRNGRFGLVMLVIVVALVMMGGVVFLGREIFKDSDSAVTADKNSGDATLLTKPTDKTKIIMNVRGPIVARESHYEVAINITANKRQMIIYRGYEKSQEVKKIDLSNDMTAFKGFTAALYQANFISKTESIQRDQGMCATGQLIDFAINEGDKNKFSSWTASCPGVGNFSGSNERVANLILAQIPGARKAIDEVK